jgi:hypothetical protein
MRSALLLLAALSGPALGCGYCLEDKVAAAYDHAVLTKAAAAKHQVAFFHVDGAAPRAALQKAVYAAGADRGSVRIATEQQALSFAFDPKKTPLASIQSRIEKAGRVTLMPLEVKTGLR